MNARAFSEVCVAASVVALCAFSLLGREVGEPRVAAQWTYCTGLEEGVDEWEIHTPRGAPFEVELVDGVLRFRGTADAPEFAPQASLAHSPNPSMANILEVAALVDIRELGGVFALDVDDADGRFNWSLDVSASQISFGYVDSTCGCGSGWTLLKQLDADSWTLDSIEGEHVLRVAFERGVVRAYVDLMRVASFGLPDDLGQAIVRLSVGPTPPPEGDSATIELTDVRALQVCFAEEI